MKGYLDLNEIADYIAEAIVEKTKTKSPDTWEHAKDNTFPCARTCGEVLDELCGEIERNGKASVYDFFVLLDGESIDPAKRYGWRDLSMVEIKPIHSGKYYIAFPMPILLTSSEEEEKE